MPEFLVLRKRKFEALKNLYNEKQLTATIFKNSVQKIIDEIQMKIKQFTNTERKLRNYLLVFDKKAPRIPLRPKEKETAEQFLRELLTELENDTTRSEYKNELEGFLIELLNEIDVPLTETILPQSIETPLNRQEDKTTETPLIDSPENKTKQQIEQKETILQTRPEDKQTEQPVLHTKKLPFRDYFNTSKFNELSKDKQEEIIYFDDERGYRKIMKDYLDNNTKLNSKQVKTIVNSPLYVIKDWYLRNKITYPIDMFLDAYKNARKKGLVKKKSDGYESSYEELLSDDFKNLSLEQQEEELKSSGLFRKVIDMYLDRKKLRFSKPQHMSYDMIKRSMLAGGADFPVKKLINRLIKIASILAL